MKKQMEIGSYLNDVKLAELKKVGPAQGYYYFIGEEAAKHYKKIVLEHALPFQKKGLLDTDKETVHFSGKKGFVWIQKRMKPKYKNHSGLFNETYYGAARDGLGALVGFFRALNLKEVSVKFLSADVEEIVGALVGLDLGSYNFKGVFDGKGSFEGLPKIYLSSVGEEVDDELVLTAKEISYSVNTARHLTNLPPNVLNPEFFQNFIETTFKKQKDFTIEVLDKNQLEKEGMGLHLAVGQGATFPPRLVILKYKPKGLEKTQPITFVGKGITFDTGGLDIKPSSAMRLMKKDMGGAATVLGSALWVLMSKPKIHLEFYFAIAENSVDASSFRPGDIIKARNGMNIEIHNTDAEGRLVLADALDKALSAKPKCIVDVATLTGAIKVALGADLPGLFSNNDELSDLMIEAGMRAAEPSWRMPLVPKYASQMNSSFAGMTNAVDGFGGAITAALFLEKFIKETPWAHLDIYAWADKASGAIGAAGGNGQAVQTLAALISILEKNPDLDFT